MKLSKKKWLEQEVMCDEWGRPPSLADVPLTMMKRKNLYEVSLMISQIGMIF